MQVQSAIPKTVNPDLQKERNKADFKVEEFAEWWHNGAEKLKFKRDLENFMFKDYDNKGHLVHYLDYEETYDLSVQQSIHVAKKLKEYQQLRNPGGNDIWPGLFSSMITWTMVPLGNPNDAQFALLLAALRTQCTDEQYQRFGKRVENYEVCCSFAQTELGHGTFVRGLETRADYDRTTQEFVMHTPTITAYKWWPGGLGHSANYALVVAQLYIDNESKGVHMFWVQVRDEETHLPLPGIDIGDIGKKHTFPGMNNGFLGMQNVRIPRGRMLMRNAEVLPDGTYIKHSDSVVTYFALVFGRVFIARYISTYLARASVIATRYASVRRQCPINNNEREVQIIDHVTQQMKLFSEIATSVAIKVAAESLNDMYEAALRDLYAGSTTRLPEIHAFSCVMKVLSSNDCSLGLERLRLACGGHGASLATGLPTAYLDCVSGCLVEGENTVLLLQVGRFLMKSWRAALAGEPLSETIAYLAKYKANRDMRPWSATRRNIVEALQYASANKIRLAYESLVKRMQNGQPMGEATNNTGIQLTQAAELYGRCKVCSIFFEEICGSKSRTRSPSLNKILENLLDIYLVHTALNQMQHILRAVNLTDKNLCELQDWLEQSLSKLRPNAVAVCDGFDFHDIVIGSTLGSYDGNVYERIFAAAKESPMNKHKVRNVFHEHMKPFFKSNM